VDSPPEPIDALTARLVQWFPRMPTLRLGRIARAVFHASYLARSSVAITGMPGAVEREGYGMIRRLLRAPGRVPLCYFYLRFRLYYTPRWEASAGGPAPDWWARAADDRDLFLRMARAACRAAEHRRDDVISVADGMYNLWRTTQ
jgi:hypothetical protein